MKRLLRLVVKIVTTPLVVPAMLALLAMSYAFQFYDWLWEESELTRKIDAECTADMIANLKRWFTQL
jgi:hypothetical protein